MLGHVEEAIGLAELLSEPMYRASVLLQIGQHLTIEPGQKRESLQLLQRSYEIVRSLEKSDDRLHLLQELDKELTKARQWEQDKEVIQSIEEDWAKAQMLRELGTALTQAQQWEQADAVWAEAERVAQSFEEDWAKAQALRELGTALAQAQRWEQAKEVIQSIDSGWDKAQVLRELGTALTQAQQWEQADAVWAEAEQVVWFVVKEQNRERLSYELGTALAQTQRWDRAEVVSRSIDERKDRTLRLYKLVKVLTQAEQWDRADALWVEALLLSNKIKGSEDPTLMPHKTNDEVAAQSAEAEEFRYKILCEMAMILVYAQQWQQVEKLLAEIVNLNHTLKRSDINIEALQNLTNALSSFGKNEYVLRLVQHSWLKADTRKHAIKLLPLAIGLIPLKSEIGMDFCQAFTWVDAFLKG